ncbi:Hypothetical protein R9X50_00323200 [Acrodontium crateriforme]|uniref:Uncharacterized protein n=1 Tax=Acrodontium crateriforme TaxID=150365 RepID=A0AAQ3R9R0_9PEZI|nr:Hypothetical protein R9X50_00323200 [Acrodontium crateriforme]
MDTNTLVAQLVAGFDALQGEYQKLHAHQATVERKLATARDQYNELAKLCGSEALVTPPISLSCSVGPRDVQIASPVTTHSILENLPNATSQQAASKVRCAADAAAILRTAPKSMEAFGNSVKIWSGPSADKPDGSGSMMPSISESPLERDFTIEGMPSRLGCPFASMTKNRKLSSHAASVLSKYNNTQGSVAAAGSTPLSSVNRVNGKESLARLESRRASLADPIKAEICGLSDRDSLTHDERSNQAAEPNGQETAEAGVCPIRFLDQHSPEEVATYFEKHKHELPLSHEVCVRRYQNNENQVRELDAKYDNLASMIQGLGAKHKEMLPEDPDDDGGEATPVDDEKIRRWASSVSGQAVDGQETEEPADEERQSHFDRPFRDVRVGESPSRPWGIQVPIHFLEKQAGRQTNSPPARMADEHGEDQESLRSASKPLASSIPVGKCPFSSNKNGVMEQPILESLQQKTPLPQGWPLAHDKAQQQPVFFASYETTGKPETVQTGTKGGAPPVLANTASSNVHKDQRDMVFTGPVFIGYSADDAARIAKDWLR